MSLKVIERFLPYFKSSYFTINGVDSNVMMKINNQLNTMHQIVHNRHANNLYTRVIFHDDHGVNFTNNLGLSMMENGARVITTRCVAGVLTLKSTGNFPNHTMYQIRNILKNYSPSKIIEDDIYNGYHTKLVSKWMLLDDNKKRSHMINLNHQLNRQWVYKIKSKVPLDEVPFDNINKFIFKDTMFEDMIPRCPMRDMVVQYANESHQNGRYYSPFDLDGYGIIKVSTKLNDNEAIYKSTGFISQAMRQQFIQGMLDYGIKVTEM